MERLNEFLKFGFTETSIMIALSKVNLDPKVHKFVHDTLIGVPGTPKYIQVDKIFYILTLSNGMSAKEAVHSLETEEGTAVIDLAKQIIFNDDFKTSENIIYLNAIIDGRMFSSHNRITRSIRKKAQEKRFKTSHEENALLLRSKLYNDELTEMGFSKIVVMHKALKDAEGKKRLLNVSINEGYECITARLDDQGNQWQSDTGFAFEMYSFTFPKVPENIVHAVKD